MYEVNRNLDFYGLIGVRITRLLSLRKKVEKLLLTYYR